MRQSYIRTFVFEDGHSEVLDIEWEIGGGTEVHDHGVSHGVIQVLAGKLTEVREDGSIHHYRPGDIFHEYPNLKHKVTNTGNCIARSRHHYTPPLTEKSIKQARGKK